MRIHGPTGNGLPRGPTPVLKTQEWVTPPERRTRQEHNRPLNREVAYADANDVELVLTLTGASTIMLPALTEGE
jgi:hypothetical protein